MSDKFTAGEQVAAADANRMWRGQAVEGLDAGETIAGATLPVPVYQNPSDNEFYACDANDTDKLEFVGFAISTAGDGEEIEIQMSGIVNGFSGLIEGIKYYVQDAVGTIGTSKGTYEVLVGMAISETELLIIKDVRRSAVASDVEQAGTGGSGSTTSATYSKAKEIAINIPGTIRVKFELKSSSGSNSFGKIYVNGEAVGTERTTTSGTYVEYSEDITVVKGDRVQLYVKSGNGGSSVEHQAFKLYYDSIYGETENQELL